MQVTNGWGHEVNVVYSLNYAKDSRVPLFSPIGNKKHANKKGQLHSWPFGMMAGAQTQCLAGSRSTVLFPSQETYTGKARTKE
jgi:hypothetical protein